jgi:undecaprenyl-diphosphatase
MSYLQAIILGLVQGLGEFLPISSSAHLILVPYIFGWAGHSDEFDIALHLGTLLAVVSFFGQDIVTLVKAGFSKSLTAEKKLFWLVILATIPAGLIGFFFEDFVDSKLRSAILLIAIAMGVVSIVLVWADKIGHKKEELGKINIVEALVIGFSQAIALLPGVSRSGATMTTGLLFGLKREAAARFSFLMSIPIILGAGLLKISNLHAHDINGPFFIGVLVAAITGYFSIRWLLNYLNKGSYVIFAWYRFIFAVIVIIIVLNRS